MPPEARVLGRNDRLQEAWRDRAQRHADRVIGAGTEHGAQHDAAAVGVGHRAAERRQLGDVDSEAIRNDGRRDRTRGNENRDERESTRCHE